LHENDGRKWWGQFPAALVISPNESASEMSIPTSPIGNNRPRWNTISEAADYLGVTPKTIRNYLGRGYFPGYRIPRTRGVRVNLNDIDKAMRSLPTSVARAGTPHYGPLAKIIDMRPVTSQPEADQ
jgi:excisionase family DNA binding protein